MERADKIAHLFRVFNVGKDRHTAFGAGNRIANMMGPVCRYKKGLELRRNFASKPAKMAAVDPSYPLYPIACILSAAMLLLVLLTSFIRQSWNLGVAFLCFWLFFENLNSGINAIVWSGNADIRLYVYCDIGSSIGIESPK